MKHLMTYSHPASSNYPSRTGSEIRAFMQAVGRIRTSRVLAHPIALPRDRQILIERITSSDKRALDRLIST